MILSRLNILFITFQHDHFSKALVFQMIWSHFAFHYQIVKMSPSCYNISFISTDILYITKYDTSFVRPTRASSVIQYVFMGRSIWYFHFILAINIIHAMHCSYFWVSYPVFCACTRCMYLMVPLPLVGDIPYDLDKHSVWIFRQYTN